MNSDSGGTRVSLLVRLQEGVEDETAWNEFVARYGPKIASWCARWHLQPADADDVTQKVLLQLAVKIRHFVYDPKRSFRAWLKTLTRHALSDFLADEARLGAENAAGLETLQELPARADLEKQLADVFDLELLEFATARVQQRVEPKTWEIFRLAALEGLPGIEVASRLGIPVANIYKAKSNVQKLIKQEILVLEEATEP